MANYCGKMRTNYFRIKDKEAFLKLCDGLCAESDISVEVKEYDDGLYGNIYCDDTLDFKTNKDNEDNDDFNMDEFYTRMRDIVAEDDAMIMIEIGWEKLRYLIGMAVIVTSSKIKVIDIKDLAVKYASDALLNKDYDTEMDY